MGSNSNYWTYVFSTKEERERLINLGELQATNYINNINNDYDNSYNNIQINHDISFNLNNISFDGNSFYSSDYLKSIISIKEKKFFTLLSQSNFITENKITNAINNISKLYKDFGFFDIKINFTVKEFKNKIHLSLFIE